MSTFDGFREPTENWSKLPHQLIEALPQIETLAEMKVILYILRHTWGYHDTEKRITLDEFCNGRKRRDGSRIDNGIGMSKPSIVDGITRAEQHGFIVIETDAYDLARIRKVYRLNDGQVLRNFTPDVKKFNTCGKETLQRSEKETDDRNSETNPSAPAREKSPEPEKDGDAVLDDFFGERKDPPPEQREPFNARELTTEEGRHKMQERLAQGWRERLEGQPWLSWKNELVERYRFKSTTNRGLVLWVCWFLEQRGVLTTNRRTDVNFWLSEAVVLTEMAEQKREALGMPSTRAVLETALEQALASGMTIKSPKSCQFALSNLRSQATTATPQPQPDGYADADNFFRGGA